MIAASLETLYMVFVSGTLAFLFGLPIGILLFFLHSHLWIYRILSFLVNLGRSFPFAILMIALIPLTRFIVGTSLGTTAAIVPLTFAGAPFVARLVESSLLAIPKELIEAAHFMGASKKDLIFKVLLPESFPSLIQASTLTLINLIGYSAMAGLVGGGGLGQVAIQYGYHRFNVAVMMETILYLIVFVECVEQSGRLFYRRLLKTRGINV